MTPTTTPIPTPSLVKTSLEASPLASFSVLFSCRSLKLIILTILMFLFQQEDLVPDRFVIYGEDYKKVREAMAKTVLSASHRELTEVLQV